MTLFAHGWIRLLYVLAYYFVLHPVSTAMFIYTLLRSMVLTLRNDGIVWRGTKYPLEELRKEMVWAERTLKCGRPR